MELFIYTGATDLTAAVVTSASNLTPVSEVSQIVFGDTEPLTLRFISDAAGTSPSWVGVSGHTVDVTLGKLDTNGTIQYCGTSNFTYSAPNYTGYLYAGTSALATWLAGEANRTGYLTLQIRHTDTAGRIETLALQYVLVCGSVPSTALPDDTPIDYATYAEMTASQTAAAASATAAAAAQAAAEAAAGTSANLQQLSGLTVDSDELAEIDSARKPAGINPRFLPQTGTIYAFGDSQTYGSNAATGTDYASGGRLLAAYRFVDMLAGRDQRSLTISNLAVGGSRVSWADTATYYEQWSQFNAWGQMDYNWEGAVVMMCGWNNTNPNTTSDGFHAVMLRSYEALIARSLIDDYGGISINGWTREGTSYTLPSWSTTGGNNGYQYSAAADRRKVMPFYFGDASASRYRVDLETTEYVQFTLTSKRAAALFFETSNDGGAVAVSVNGVVVWTGTSYYDSTDQFPQVVWLDNLPTTAVIKFYGALGASEHCYWLGAGWVDANTSRAKERSILFGTTVANTAGSRALTTLQRLSAQAAAAAATFADYPVYFADVFNAWIQSTDSEPQDVSHLTPVGNEHVYSAFRQAERLSKGYSPNRVDVQRIAIESALAFGATGQTQLATSTGSVLVGPTSPRSNYSVGTLKVQIEGTTSPTSRIGLARSSADAVGPFIVLAKSRGATVGSSTVAQSGDGIGGYLFAAADGTNLVNAASVLAEVDGTPGTNDMPGRLLFNTTADGAAAPTERMRIDSAGRIFFAQNTVSLTFGSGDPEGAVTAVVGSLYLRTDGSTSTTLYVKTSGTGNTGWTAK